MPAFPVRRSAIAASAVAFASLFLLQPSQAEDPRASLILPRTSYLSTEDASASLVIYNTTSTALSYNPLSVSFVIRGDDGRSYERHWITSVSRPFASISIGPGERRRVAVGLPTCEVESDPCTEHVSVKFFLVGKDDPGRSPVVTPEVSYSFVADPTATFRISGLRGNRPLFLTQYEAGGSVLQRLLTIRFQFDAAPNASGTEPPEGTKMQQIFQRRGLTAALGLKSEPAGFEVSLSLRQRDADSSVEGAIADVRRSFGPRVKLVSELYEPDSSDVLSFVDEALEGARAAAERISDYVGGGALSVADGEGLDGAERLKIARPGDEARTDFRPIADYLSGDALLDGEASATKSLLNVRLRATFGFTGDTVAYGSAALPVDAEMLAYFGGATHSLGLPSRTVVAADRPEIYAIGATTRRATDRLGMQATAVATHLAFERARALAELLGVKAAAVTLVAAYPEVDDSADDVVIASGVARAPAGDLDRSWRALLPPKAVSPPGPIPVSRPTPSPRPPMPAASAESYLVPISVPDDRTVLAVRGDEPVPINAAMPVNGDYRTLVRSAETLSLKAALHAAVDRSMTPRKQLRHLILAIAEPPSVELGDVRAPVELIFRTR